MDVNGCLRLKDQINIRLSSFYIFRPGRSANEIASTAVCSANLSWPGQGEDRSWSLLLIAAKVVFSSNRNQLRYSIHDARTPTMIGFLGFLDCLGARLWPWRVNKTTGNQPMLA